MSDQLLNLFAPNYCLSCDDIGEVICPPCRLDIVHAQASVCYRCNKLSDDNRTCAPCRSSSPVFSLDWTVEYEGIAKRLIQRSKFGSSRAALKAMAGIMHEETPLRDVDTVTYVPTATSRVRQRGLDHARLIAKYFCDLRGLKMARLLARKGQDKQMGAGRQKRRNQLKTAFRPLYPLQGATILLIDDVVSTGASIENCAKALKSAGCKRIYAVVFARNSG